MQRIYNTLTAFRYSVPNKPYHYEKFTHPHAGLPAKIYHSFFKPDLPKSPLVSAQLFTGSICKSCEAWFTRVMSTAGKLFLIVPAC